MEVGLQFIFQNMHEGMSDAEMFIKETELAVKAEAVGMDFILAPEHHFDPNYSMMPDNMQWLAWVAAKTEHMKLGTGAIILPWWPNPTRVAEKVAMLDILCGGRLLLGFGRGLARKEYEAFGIDMNESRERFDLAAEIILDILDTGIAEYDTPYFKQTRTEIHPTPIRGFREGEFFSVAMSPDSGIAAANIGGTMMSFIQGPFEGHAEAIKAWQQKYHEVRPGETPGAPVLTDFTYCHEDAEVAERVAREYLSKYFVTVVKHYDFDGTHWGDTKGYQSYAAGAGAIREFGLEAAVDAFIESQCWGTPDQILEKYKKRIELVGDIRCNMAISYAGMPFETAYASLELIGREVAPQLRAMHAPAAASA
jgi:alkanesulfonate monooxygenase SsuD/methylene tetrahydromethanopterin reductase-like flavin-dependent oxidoreductase (luciferase family)